MSIAKPMYRCKLLDIKREPGSDKFRLVVEMIDVHPRSTKGVGAVMVTSSVLTLNFYRRFATTQNSRYKF